MRSFLETGGKILRAFVNVYLQVRLLQHLLLQLFLLLLLLPPESLLDARLQVGHLPDALLVDLAVIGLHHLVHLLDQLLLHLGVLGQAVGQGGEGAGGCLKASKDEDDRLAQL